MKKKELKNDIYKNTYIEYVSIKETFKDDYNVENIDVIFGKDILFSLRYDEQIKELTYVQFNKETLKTFFDIIGLNFENIFKKEEKSLEKNIKNIKFKNKMQEKLFNSIKEGSGILIEEKIEEEEFINHYFNDLLDYLLNTEFIFVKQLELIENIFDILPEKEIKNKLNIFNKSITNNYSINNLDNYKKTSFKNLKNFLLKNLSLNKIYIDNLKLRTAFVLDDVLSVLDLKTIKNNNNNNYYIKPFIEYYRNLENIKQIQIDTNKVKYKKDLEFINAFENIKKEKNFGIELNENLYFDKYSEPVIKIDDIYLEKIIKYLKNIDNFDFASNPEKFKKYSAELEKNIYEIKTLNPYKYFIKISEIKPFLNNNKLKQKIPLLELMDNKINLAKNNFKKYFNSEIIKL